ncbi:hypothetical protein D3C85_1936280 [compost metagenome]
MVKVNLTLDEFTDRILKLMAIEYAKSRSEIIRTLIKSKVESDNGMLRKYADLISQNYK